MVKVLVWFAVMPGRELVNAREERQADNDRFGPEILHEPDGWEMLQAIPEAKYIDQQIDVIGEIAASGYRDSRNIVSIDHRDLFLGELHESACSISTVQDRLNRAPVNACSEGEAEGLQKFCLLPVGIRVVRAAVIRIILIWLRVGHVADTIPVKFVFSFTDFEFSHIG